MAAIRLSRLVAHLLCDRSIEGLCPCVGRPCIQAGRPPEASRADRSRPPPPRRGRAHAAFGSAGIGGGVRALGDRFHGGASGSRPGGGRHSPGVILDPPPFIWRLARNPQRGGAPPPPLSFRASAPTGCRCGHPSPPPPRPRPRPPR